MERSSRIYTPRFLYYYWYDLATAHDGWFNPFQRFCPLRALPLVTHTHDLDAAGYDLPREFGIGL